MIKLYILYCFLAIMRKCNDTWISHDKTIAGNLIYKRFFSIEDD